MAITVIVENGDLNVEVIEYDDKIKDGSGKKMVAQKVEFRVRRDVLSMRSTVFGAMLRPGNWKEAEKDMIELQEDSVASMGIWFSILHDAEPTYDVKLEEMWRLVTACDKYHLDLNMLKPWFATWYQKHDIEQYYKNWAIKDPQDSDCLTPRSLLYPCWIFDHAVGFMRVTHFLSYKSIGHITEYNPTTHRDLHVENRVIQQLNAAKGRLRTVILNELFRPNESLLQSGCRCKEATLFGYEKELYTIEVWPLERAHQRHSMTDILELLNRFSFEAKLSACVSCRKDYKRIVKDAQIKVRHYFDGLCLDCMDKTKPVTKDEDMDYWQHNALKESDFFGHCRKAHRQPTWYFSFMGRIEVRNRFFRNRRKWHSFWDSESD